MDNRRIIHFISYFYPICTRKRHTGIKSKIWTPISSIAIGWEWILCFPVLSEISQTSILYHSIHLLSTIFWLFFTESRAECLSACARMVPLDINMLCTAAVIRIVHAFHGLTIDADMLAWVWNCTCKAIAAPLVKALTAGIITVAGMFSSHHDIALATAAVFVVGTITYSTG